jgi:hypothetical protein
MNAELAAVAQGIYQDTNAAIPLRVAAATALEPFDAKAAAYAMGQIESYLTQFSGQAIDESLAEVLRARRTGSNTADTPTAQFSTFIHNTHIMSALLVLKSESVHQLTVQHLTSRNGWIREVCGIVAARRWPADLLKSGQGVFSNQEYANLAAVIVAYRPDQAAAAAAAVPADRLAAASSRLTANGLGVFLEAGGVLSHF